MMWRRRSSSISSDTEGGMKIEQLNSRFRLRIPTSTKSKIVVKGIFLHSDDSTCSTSSNRSNQSSNNTTTAKRVHFCDQVVIFVPSMTFPSDSEATAIWFSRKEITDMKNSLRHIWKGSHINDPDFVLAVELVKNLFSGHYVPLDENVNGLDKTMVDSQTKQLDTYKECARIMARHEGRGLERMHYGKSTGNQSGAKSPHVRRYIWSVLELQKQNTAESLPAAVIAQCNSLPSTWWARISADVDVESFRNDAAHTWIRTKSIEV